MSEIRLDLSEFVIESPPGDTLADVLDARGLTQAELALRTGRPLKTINEIIKGKASITADTALQFERVLGIPATFWINRESQYRESQARQAEKQELQKYQDWLSIFPLKEMIEWGWIRKFDNSIDQVLELLRFFGIAKPEHWSIYWKTAIPKIEEFSSFQHAPGSTTAWLRKGEIEFQKIDCNEFHSRTLKDLFPYFYNLIDKSVDVFYPELVHNLAQSGVAFSVVQNLPGAEIRAITRWLAPRKASLQLSNDISLRKDFWLALYRGLAYILLQRKRNAFVIEKQDREPSLLSAEAENLVQGFLSDVDWSNIDPEISWETLKQNAYTDPLWQDFEEASVNVVSIETPEKSEEKANNLELSGWPGLSAGALQALMAAGLMEEASDADERLFAEWVQQKLASVESALLQGYIRDALMDLQELQHVVQIGSNRSPALVAMLSSLTLLKALLEKQYKPDQTTLLLEIKQLIAQANQETHQALISEERIRYSAATNVKPSLAENLFKF